MRNHLPLTLLDQAVLSAFNLGVNLFLLAVVSPEGFGKFAFALATILIFGSLQNALVGMPIMVYVPPRSEAEQESLLASLWRVDLLFRLLACALGISLFAVVDGSPNYLAAATLALGATLWRDTARATLFATTQFARCLIMDTFSVVAAIAVTLLLHRMIDPMIAVLAGIAFGCGLAVTCVAKRPKARRVTLRGAIRDYADLWPEIRWSFVGAGTTELQGRSYVFALERLRGFDALGNIQAGRVLVGPATLSADAWAAVARPAMARALAAGRLHEATGVLRDGALLMTALVAAYSGALWVFWPYVEGLIFRGRYPEIGFLVACWLTYALVCVANVVVSVFVQAARDFKGLAFTTIGSTAAVLVLLAVLFWPVPNYYAIAAVTVGELLALVWTCILALRIVVRARSAMLHEASTA